jgi:hypothetical protein
MQKNLNLIQRPTKAKHSLIIDQEGFRAPKRLRVEEDVLSPRYKINASVDFESYCSQIMFLSKETQKNSSYPAHDVNFSWNFTAAFPYPVEYWSG